MSRKQLPNRRTRRAKTRWFARHKHLLRNGVLVVLLTAIPVQSVLLWREVLPQHTLSLPHWLLSSEQTQTDDAAGTMPIRFASRSKNGVFGVEYNMDGVKQAYEQTADVWMQALSHASKPYTTTMETYSRALSNQLLMMQYDGQVPAAMIANWLGCSDTKNLADCALGTVLLSKSKDGYQLYFRDSSSGTIKRTDTSVQDEDFRLAVEQFEPNGCSLAVDEKTAAISPDVLYNAGGMKFDVMSFAPYTGEDGIEQVLTAFGLQAEDAVQHAYTSGGKTVYVSGKHTFRLGGDGTAVYDGTGIGVSAAHGQKLYQQDVQTAYRLTGEILEAIGSGAVPALKKTYTDDGGKYIVVYGMQINGVPVDNAASGYLARYTFDNGLPCAPASQPERPLPSCRRSRRRHRWRLMRMRSSACAMSIRQRKPQTTGAIPMRPLRAMRRMQLGAQRTAMRICRGTKCRMIPRTRTVLRAVREQRLGMTIPARLSRRSGMSCNMARKMRRTRPTGRGRRIILPL